MKILYSVLHPFMLQHNIHHSFVSIFLDVIILSLHTNFTIIISINSNHLIFLYHADELLFLDSHD